MRAQHAHMQQCNPVTNNMRTSAKKIVLNHRLKRLRQLRHNLGAAQLPSLPRHAQHALPRCLLLVLRHPHVHLTRSEKGNFNYKSSTVKQLGQSITETANGCACKVFTVSAAQARAISVTHAGTATTSNVRMGGKTEDRHLRLVKVGAVADLARAWGRGRRAARQPRLHRVSKEDRSVFTSSA